MNTELDNIHVAVVGHDHNLFPQISCSILHPVLLQNLTYTKSHYSSNSLGESRFFLADNYFNCDTEIAGCLTASWDRKYTPHKINNILDWPAAGYFEQMRSRKDIVLCSTLCYGRYAKPNAPMWEINFQKHFRNSWLQSDWIENIIFKITGLKYNEENIAPYANQIICNITLFKELCNFIKSIIDDIILNFGLYPNFSGSQIDQKRTLAYIMEEITMLWWSKHSNINYVSCGRIVPGWYK